MGRFCLHAVSLRTQDSALRTSFQALLLQLLFAMKRTFLYASFLTGLCLVLAALTLSLSGCSTLAKTLNIVNPSYSLRDIRPHVAIALPISASSIDLDFDVGVDNPNSVGLRLDRLDFDVLVNDNPLLTQVSTPQSINIPARGVGQ